ncbi:MAG TPA: class I SAM-dependent methyltransferase, partial [Gemmatimonadaceae bacterium]|nr:class I SAM-dependent methyltransferase [Gemmatimonadaceae bacterium]
MLIYRQIEEKPNQHHPLSIHHQAKQGYTNGSATYDRGRPEYSAAVHHWLRDTLCVGPQRVVLDLGAGTGKFTHRLIETGATVIAVEPVAAMLAVLRNAIPDIGACQATAESVPVANGA